MTTRIAKCIAAVEAAGWTGEAAIRLVCCPQSETDEGFSAQLAGANGIRALITFAESTLAGCGVKSFNGLAEEFVAGGFSYEDVRLSIVELMAESDVHTSNVRKLEPSTPSGDVKAVYAQHEAQIDKLAGR